tara:strand:+ start:1910 stop:2386 length:477 start_codon:yes stop_codon:yes gene_type:complete
MFEVFNITANIIRKINKSICIAPNTLSIHIHNSFIEISNNTKYYIQKKNTLMEKTSLFTLTNEREMQKITTNFFIPYIILFYKNQAINLELQDNEYTFYIIGNKINRDLIKFYLEKKKNIIMSDDDTYSLEFMTTEGKPLFLTEESELYFDKDSYKVI